MTFTTASTPEKTAFKNNRLLQLILILFCCGWCLTLFTAANINTWLLENLLVFALVSFLIITFRYYTFSDWSYICIFLFLLMHMYGAAYVYDQNPFGAWLQEQFGSSRNNYDRIVHFFFGFLLAYPMRESCLNYFRLSPTASWVFPVIFSMALGAFYEGIEWLLADVFFPAQGENFIGMQGDKWDAQKDMFLAFLGSFCGVALISIAKKFFPVKWPGLFSSFHTSLEKSSGSV
jgi:putative membrane protein